MKKTVKILAMFLAMAMMFSTAQIAFAAEEVSFDRKIDNIISVDVEDIFSEKEIFSFFDSDLTAAEDIDEEDGWKFVEEDGYALIIEAPEPKSGKTIKMPETLGGSDVVAWDFEAFADIDVEYKLRLADNFPEAFLGFSDYLDINDDEIFETIVELLIVVAPTDFKVGAKNEYFSVKHGVLYSKDKTVLVRYPVGRDADFYYLPKKAVTFKENGSDFYCLVPFAKFDLEDFEAVSSDITVHVHEAQMQALYDYIEDLEKEYRPDKEDILFALGVVLIESFMSVEEICSDWDEDDMELIDEVSDAFEDYTGTFSTAFSYCEESHISDMPAWEAFLMIFFLGWIWY